MARVEGPVVQEIDAIFVTDWYSETDEIPGSTAVAATADDDDPATLLAQIAPSGPAFDSENNLALFNSLIYAAEHRVVDHEPLLRARTSPCSRPSSPPPAAASPSSCSSARSATSSWCSTPSTRTTRSCCEAGVRIYEYPAPTILHAKHMSIDDLVSVVGSSNLDIRSFQLDLELTMLVSGRSFTDGLKAVEDEYRARSKELTLEKWQGRGVLHAFVDGVARLTSAVQ